MKTNRIQWSSGRGSVHINGKTDYDLSCSDEIINTVLKSRNVSITTNWDAAFTASAMVSDDDIAAIRATVAGIEQKTIQVVTCKRCGATNISGARFTTLSSQSICDDCA